MASPYHFGFHHCAVLSCLYGCRSVSGPSVSQLGAEVDYLASILVDMFVQRVKASRIGFECAGVGVMSLFQVGVAVSATVNGPPTYCTTNST